MSTTTSYTVTGMTCGHCVGSVTKEVSAIPGVTDVKVDLESGGLTIDSESLIDFAVVEAAVDEAGYTVAANQA